MASSTVLLFGSRVGVGREKSTKTSIDLGVRRAIVPLALLVGWLTAAVLAVERGLPSKRSILAASLRAIGAKNPDPEFRNPDDLAVKFLGARERALLKDFPMDALDVNYQRALDLLSPQDRASVTTMFVRTKHMDAALDSALGDGTRQVITLGSDPRIDNPGTRFARWGEPWVFGFPGQSAVDSLRNAGLAMVSDESMSELAARHAQRRDGTTTLPAVSGDQDSRRICIAQVPATSQ